MGRTYKDYKETLHGIEVQLTVNSVNCLQKMVITSKNRRTKIIKSKVEPCLYPPMGHENLSVLTGWLY